MVRDPYGYWLKAMQREKNGVSKFTLVGKLVLFSTNTDVSRRILTYNGPDALEMVGTGGITERVHSHEHLYCSCC